MHVLRAMVPALSATLAMTAAAAARCDLQCRTDRYIFEYTMEQFQGAKRAKWPKELIWVDDGCTSSLDKLGHYNFLPACQRHDFGYRNYVNQGRMTALNRDILDKRFYDDLLDECRKGGDLTSWKTTGCEWAAWTYYLTAHHLGAPR